MNKKDDGRPEEADAELPQVSAEAGKRPVAKPHNPTGELLSYFARRDRSPGEDLRALAALSFLSVLSTVSLLQASMASPQGSHGGGLDPQKLLDLLPGGRQESRQDALLASLLSMVGGGAQDAARLAELLGSLLSKKESQAR